MVKKYKVKKLFFASSSSVYGLNNLPFKETQNTDAPISLYAATKKNNEVLAYYYSKQFNINIIGIRFFTVYGLTEGQTLVFSNFVSKYYQIKS